jgi:hypothetical protein
MSTEGTGKETKSGETSKGSSTATDAISKDVLKDALKEVLAENPSLLATAGRLPDDDPSKSKENSSCVGYVLVLARGKWSPPPGACNIYVVTECQAPSGAHRAVTPVLATPLRECCRAEGVSLGQQFVGRRCHCTSSILGLIPPSGGLWL